MKTVLLTLVLGGLLADAFGQGLIVYYNRVPGSVVALVYGPEAGNPHVSKTGNTSIGIPAGTQTYTGSLLVGTGYTASLWAGPADTPAEELRLVPGSLKGFRTGGFAGAIDNSGNYIEIPGVPANLSAALQLRVWDNQGGLIQSWEHALDSQTARGVSPVFNSLILGPHISTPNMVGLQGFNIYYPVPEPHALVLAGLAACLLFCFSHRLSSWTSRTI